MADYEIKGLKELLAAMKELPKAVAEKQLRASIVPGAQIIRNAAQELVQRKTGLVQRAIRIAFNKNESTEARKVYHVFVSKNVRGIGKEFSGSRATTKKIRAAGNKEKIRDAFYWRFLEFGTAKMSAKPFMRPAFDSMAGDAVNRIKERLASGIEKEAARLGKG